jgi:hypothetical protein
LTRASLSERKGERVGTGIQVTDADADADPLVDSRSLAADEYHRSGRVGSLAGLQFTHSAAPSKGMPINDVCAA